MFDKILVPIFINMLLILLKNICLEFKYIISIEKYTHNYWRNVVEICIMFILYSSYIIGLATILTSNYQSEWIDDSAFLPNIRDASRCIDSIRSIIFAFRFRATAICKPCASICVHLHTTLSWAWSKRTSHVPQRGGFWYQKRYTHTYCICTKCSAIK